MERSSQFRFTTCIVNLIPISFGTGTSTMQATKFHFGSCSVKENYTAHEIQICCHTVFYKLLVYNKAPYNRQLLSETFSVQKGYI